ncbi:MAG: hypothetical protein CMJ33_00345 [Phycisphaerae bacterium]|nr:hypothetical protein [Phycisphaerae bacterium]HAW96482.1 hypothetical protein [Phycisphaerales bacterium]
MINAAQRYMILLGALLLTPFIVMPAIAWRLSEWGGPSPLAHGALSPLMADLGLLLSLVVLLALGAVVSRGLNTAVGLFVIGFGVCLIALRCDTVETFAWSGASVWSLGVETILWIPIVALITIVVFRFSSGLRDVYSDYSTPPAGSFESMLSRDGLAMLLCGIPAVAVTWALLANWNNGQVLGAVFVGSLIGGVVGRLALPRTQPILVFVGPILVGGIAQIVFASGFSGSMSDALVAGSAPRLLWVMPMDWVGGTLGGTAFGLGVARMFFGETLELAAKPRSTARA